MEEAVEVISELAQVEPWVMLGLTLLVIAVAGIVWIVRELAKLNESIDSVLRSSVGQVVTSL